MACLSFCRLDQTDPIDLCVNLATLPSFQNDGRFLIYAAQPMCLAQHLASPTRHRPDLLLQIHTSPANPGSCAHPTFMLSSCVRGRGSFRSHIEAVGSSC